MGERIETMRRTPGTPWADLGRTPASAGWSPVFKRGVDVVLSAFFLTLLAPFFLLIALWIKLDSRGPVFYRQTRVGRGGELFTFIKFRSMRADAEKSSGPIWAWEGDPRVTRVGQVLRRVSLDELPQLWNVLRGDMSLVGPRPERPYFVERFQGQVPYYADRHRVKPGMTGWAQVNGLRGNVSIWRRTAYDLYYIEHGSVALDLKILFMTVFNRKAREGAY